MWGQVSGTTEGQQNVFPDRAQGSFSRSLIELVKQADEFNYHASDKFAYSLHKRSLPIFLWDWG